MDARRNNAELNRVPCKNPSKCVAQRKVQSSTQVIYRDEHFQCTASEQELFYDCASETEDCGSRPPSLCDAQAIRVALQRTFNDTQTLLKLFDRPNCSQQDRPCNATLEITARLITAGSAQNAACRLYGKPVTVQMPLEFEQKSGPKAVLPAARVCGANAPAIQAPTGCPALMYMQDERPPAADSAVREIDAQTDRSYLKQQLKPNDEEQGVYENSQQSQTNTAPSQQPAKDPKICMCSNGSRQPPNMHYPTQYQPPAADDPAQSKSLSSVPTKSRCSCPTDDKRSKSALNINIEPDSPRTNFQDDMDWNVCCPPKDSPLGLPSDRSATTTARSCAKTSQEPIAPACLNNFNGSAGTTVQSCAKTSPEPSTRACFSDYNGSAGTSVRSCAKTAQEPSTRACFSDYDGSADTSVRSCAKTSQEPSGPCCFSDFDSSFAKGLHTDELASTTADSCSVMGQVTCLCNLESALCAPAAAIKPAHGPGEDCTQSNAASSRQPLCRKDSCVCQQNSFKSVKSFKSAKSTIPAQLSRLCSETYADCRSSSKTDVLDNHQSLDNDCTQNSDANSAAADDVSSTAKQVKSCTFVEDVGVVMDCAPDCRQSYNEAQQQLFATEMSCLGGTNNCYCAPEDTDPDDCPCVKPTRKQRIQQKLEELSTAADCPCNTQRLAMIQELFAELTMLLSNEAEDAVAPCVAEPTSEAVEQNPSALSKKQQKRQLCFKQMEKYVTQCFSKTSKRQEIQIYNVEFDPEFSANISASGTLETEDDIFLGGCQDMEEEQTPQFIDCSDCAEESRTRTEEPELLCNMCEELHAFTEATTQCNMCEEQTTIQCKDESLETPPTATTEPTCEPCVCCHCRALICDNECGPVARTLEAAMCDPVNELKYFIDSVIIDLESMDYVLRANGIKPQKQSDECGREQSPNPLEGYPVSITQVSSLGCSALYVRWEVHDCVGIAGYEVYVDGQLRNRLYSFRHDASVAANVDVTKRHQLVLRAQPTGQEFPGEETEVSQAVVRAGGGDKTWSPSVYFYEPA